MKSYVRKVIVASILILPTIFIVYYLKSYAFVYWDHQHSEIPTKLPETNDQSQNDYVFHSVLEMVTKFLQYPGIIPILCFSMGILYRYICRKRQLTASELYFQHTVKLLEDIDERFKKYIVDYNAAIYQLTARLEAQEMAVTVRGTKQKDLEPLMKEATKRYKKIQYNIRKVARQTKRFNAENFLNKLELAMNLLKSGEKGQSGERSLLTLLINEVFAEELNNKLSSVSSTSSLTSEDDFKVPDAANKHTTASVCNGSEEYKSAQALTENYDAYKERDMAVDKGLNISVHRLLKEERIAEYLKGVERERNLTGTCDGEIVSVQS